MNDLEFVLTDAGVNYPNIPEDQMRWIKESLIPYWEGLNHPVFGSTICICHSKTGEVRTLNRKNVISMLKNLF